MNIQSINFINNKEKNNNLYFKAIKLNANQLKESKKLLEDFVACPDSQLERMKLKVFKFFEKDLLNELELKYKKYYIKEDCLQDLFLSFFELLNDLKNR